MSFREVSSVRVQGLKKGFLLGLRTWVWDSGFRCVCDSCLKF